jgi:hypothetical protein
MPSNFSILFPQTTFPYPRLGKPYSSPSKSLGTTSKVLEKGSTWSLEGKFSLTPFVLLS